MELHVILNYNAPLEMMNAHKVGLELLTIILNYFDSSQALAFSLRTNNHIR